ncbi:Uncharacterised protein [Zhongshania aliphaticivorans]|uniref:Uncharacterized protein n=1 Tax=Zhongshania aliphaticivorans TaxID=1470434 RepID=A0A5S9N8D2_9GAMM|nr:Uncharacterised protein [Zhongshania aliphaticivorans]CAA0085852.1 Uncharacterised protein [Zhongshania aliphaticivorans]
MMKEATPTAPRTLIEIYGEGVGSCSVSNETGAVLEHHLAYVSFADS